MGKFRLNRRTVLRGAGSIAIALPWLEIMKSEGPAHAAGSPALRFLSVYTPGGTVLAKWRPTGTETAPILSPILAPLEPVKSKILIVDGLEMKAAVGEQHQAGIMAWMTGTPQKNAPGNGGIPGQDSYCGGPSIDQVIATRISIGKKARGSIQMATRWGTGKSQGLATPMCIANFEDNAMHSPIPPELDPVAIWTNLFGTNNLPMASNRRKSILDFVDKRYAALSPRLGAADKQKVDQHLTKIRELEQEIAIVTPTKAVCKAPTLVDTSDYNPGQARIVKPNDPEGVAPVLTSTDGAIPKVGKLMMDMLVMALACDMTAVASLQWTDTEAKHTFPWLGLMNHHHFYQHDGGFQPVQCEQIYTWYAQQHAYLLQSMQAIDMGGHSLLDESVVFFGTELQEPPTHSKVNMPFMLAGGGGGMRTGRWVRYTGNVPHNNLLVTILNLFGDTRTTFGDPMYCTGALPNIT